MAVNNDAVMIETQTHGDELRVFADGELIGWVAKVGTACVVCAATYLAHKHDSTLIGCAKNFEDGVRRVTTCS